MIGTQLDDKIYSLITKTPFRKGCFGTPLPGGGGEGNFKIMDGTRGCLKELFSTKPTPSHQGPHKVFCQVMIILAFLFAIPRAHSDNRTKQDFTLAGTSPEYAGICEWVLCVLKP